MTEAAIVKVGFPALHRHCVALLHYARALDVALAEVRPPPHSAVSTVTLTRRLTAASSYCWPCLLGRLGGGVVI